MKNTELNFFASANSGRGFINFYGDIFSGLKKHYIIKGGPGTGKSSLMKAVAKEAECKGMTVERFYCSSDPDSLDGIIINDISVGITDGTAPHTADPKYPGICDEIINLGDFWDKNTLLFSKNHIIEATDRKAELYSNAYSYLGAALRLDEIKQRIVQKNTDTDNLLSLAATYAQTIPSRKGKTHIRLTDGITMKGPKDFTPYKNEAEVVYSIKDSYGIAHLFLKYIKEYIQGSEIIISYNAFDTEKINMIYQPKDRILFCVNSKNDEEIDIDEFVSGDIQETVQIDRQINELVSNAYKLLSQIEAIHFSLEDIYISAMDFSRKEEYQDQLIKEILT